MNIEYNEESKEKEKYLNISEIPGSPQKIYSWWEDAGGTNIDHLVSSIRMKLKKHLLLGYLRVAQRRNRLFIVNDNPPEEN